jgi:glyoxylase-like metal-dependent hydrolase (beta-lactamase superfamily II)
VAQENVKQNLKGYNTSGIQVAAPSHIYDHEQTLHFGAVEVRLLHLGSARTNGDTVVYFPDLKAVAVGDLYSASPEPDFSAGGSLVGWSSVLSEVLKLDFNVVVPGKGATVSRTDLEALKGKIETLILRATLLARKGIPKDQLMAKLKTDDLGWEPNFKGEQLDRFYAELSQAK